MAASKVTLLLVCVMAAILVQSSGFKIGAGHHIFDKFAALAHIKHPKTTTLPPITIISIPTYPDTEPTVIDTPTNTDTSVGSFEPTPTGTATETVSLTDPNDGSGTGGSVLNRPTNRPINRPISAAIAAIPTTNVTVAVPGVKSFDSFEVYQDDDEGNDEIFEVDESDDDELNDEIFEIDESDLARATSPQRPKRRQNNRRKPNKQRNPLTQQQLQQKRRRQNARRKQEIQRRRQANEIIRRRNQRKRLNRIIKQIIERNRRPLKIRIRRVPNRVNPQYN